MSLLAPHRVAQPLPGGYKVGEKVFYIASSKNLTTGSKLVHGQQGKVVGPCTLTGEGVAVLFPGNTSDVYCDLSSVRRAAAAGTHTTSAPNTRQLLMASRDRLCLGPPALTA